jgi:hypothetical protein
MLLLKYICTYVCTRIKICCISNLKILNLYTPAPYPGRKRLISAYSELVLPSATMPPLQRQIRLAGSLLFLTDSKPLQPNWNAVEQAPNRFLGRLDRRTCSCNLHWTFFPSCTIATACTNIRIVSTKAFNFENSQLLQAEQKSKHPESFLGSVFTKL